MNLKRGDALRSMFMARCELGTASEAWAYVAEAFANEIRGEAIPWAHKALDEVGAPRGPDIAGRIRAFAAAPRTDVQVEVTHAHCDMTWAGVPQAGTLGERVRWLINERTRLLGATNNGAPPARLTENALNACKAFDAPTDPSDAVVFLATLLDEGDAVREELRAIIVEAIKGGERT